MKAITFAVVSLCCAVAQAELPAGLKQYIDKIEVYRAQTIKGAQEGMRNRDAEKSFRKQSAERLAAVKKVHTLD
jgi:hypothetical protein